MALTRDWMELSRAELVEAEALWYSMSSGEAMEVATRGKESSMDVESVRFNSNSGDLLF